MRAWRLAIAAGLWTALTGAATAAEAPAIAAASDLKFALPVIAKAFESETGTAVRLTFGSSGVLATQIANGAPFDVFLSADETRIDDLFARGLLRDAGQLYALGQLAIYAPERSPVGCDDDLKGLSVYLNGKGSGKIAIANPAHAPYGRTAVTALKAAELWALAEPQQVLGENAAQALAFASEGGAVAALVPAPLVEAPEFAAKGCHVRVSERLAPPLRQRLGITKTASDGGRAFAAFILSDKGRALLAKYGFSFPPRP